MLHAITWKQFGIAVVSAGLLYYLIVLFKYYRRDIIARFKRPLGQSADVPHPDIFGPVQTDESEMQLVNTRELRFAGYEEEEDQETALEKQAVAPDPDKHKVLLLGGLADFMHELKTLVRITIEAQDTKENFLELFGLIAANHSQLLDGSFNGPIIDFLEENAENLPFEFHAEDMIKVIEQINLNEEN